MNAQIDKSQYRADIDGIRALAVTAVVLFHARVPGMQGGFIGVDVFFVISGYLISGIILRGIEAGKMSLSEFYVRRVNRIIPALLVVLAFTWLLGWLFMSAGEFPIVGKHTLGGSTFSSNFFAWRGRGYFDSAENPLQHLWSLGVEEQFYLFWPLTLLLLSRTGRSIWRWSIAIIVASFLINIWLIHNRRPTASFYLPVGRFWEILAGSLLIQTELSRTPASRWWNEMSTHRREILSLCGLALIGVSLFQARTRDPWPNWQAAIPVCGTILLIASGGQTWLNSRVLSHPVPVGVGLVSYPLYLWHWPLLVFAKLVYEGAAPPGVRAAVVVASVMLAVTTYRLIERPIRFGARKRRSAVLLAPGLAITAVMGIAAYSGIVGTRLDDSRAHREARWGPEWREPAENPVVDPYGNVRYATAGGDSNMVLVYGDSNAEQYWPRVEMLADSLRRSGRRAVLITYRGCPVLPEVNRRGTGPYGRPFACDGFNRRAMRFAAGPNVKTVLIADHWELYFGERAPLPTIGDTSVQLAPGNEASEQAMQRFERDIAGLTAAGKRVYLILSNPTQAAYLRNTGIPRRFAGLGTEAHPPMTTRSEFIARTKWVNARLRLVAGRSGATVVDPIDLLCGPVECPSVTGDGEPVYFDPNHLRSGFVERHVRFLDSAILR